jgi:hypothetical protein
LIVSPEEFMYRWTTIYICTCHLAILPSAVYYPKDFCPALYFVGSHPSNRRSPQIKLVLKLGGLPPSLLDTVFSIGSTSYLTSRIISRSADDQVCYLS